MHMWEMTAPEPSWLQEGFDYHDRILITVTTRILITIITFTITAAAAAAAAAAVFVVDCYF